MTVGMRSGQVGSHGRGAVDGRWASSKQERAEPASFSCKALLSICKITSAKQICNITILKEGAWKKTKSIVVGDISGDWLFIGETPAALGHLEELLDGLLDLLAPSQE